VGEALTAAPIVGRLRAALPGLQIIHSYSSPSVAGWPAPFAREHGDYVPLDLPGPIDRLLDAVRPSLLVFARGDLWPGFVAQSAARGIPVAVIGASVRPSSLRLRSPLRSLFEEMLQTVSWIGAATPGDAERWLRLGAPPPSVNVSGDPRHDQVLERVTDLTSLGRLLEWSNEGSTLVAGSVEPSDESVLLDATQRVLSAHPSARCLVVPHSPDGRNLERLFRLAATTGVATERWTPTQEERPTARCVVVDACGLLNDLYVLGSLAYVGGGFRARKLHATIEPAAYGLPVMIGPRWDAFPDAETLVREGGAVALPRSGAAAALADQWLTWLDDRSAADMTGLAARQSLAQGAATISTARLLELLEVNGSRGASVRRSLPRR
jgi:3-deoxy-D-manno-octulosonic-acid transferase